MKISIITVCFNSEKTLADTISSVAAQNYEDIEYIVIDGASKDGTLHIINSNVLKISKYISEPDLGIYDAMNKGINMASGDVIGFLNSDDIFYDCDVIHKIASTFMSTPSLDSVYGDLLMVAPNNLNKIIRYWRPGGYRPRLCLEGWLPPHPTFYVNRERLLSANGFDLRYNLAADIDLMLRLFEIFHISSIYLPTVIIKQRVGGATTSSPLNIIRGNIQSLLSFRRNNFGWGIKFIVNKVYSKLHQYIYRPKNEN